jgi:glutamine synthetase adenylyltransferase
VRVPQQFRRDLEAIAEREHRNLSNLTDMLLEWAFEQLKAAGSIERLLKFAIRKKRG